MTHAIPKYTLEQLEADGRIELDHFTSEDAFELGTLAAVVTQEWGVSLSVEIVTLDSERRGWVTIPGSPAKPQSRTISATAACWSNFVRSRRVFPLLICRWITPS
jgi:hypothetical protein